MSLHVSNLWHFAAVKATFSGVDLQPFLTVRLVWVYYFGSNTGTGSTLHYSIWKMSHSQYPIGCGRCQKALIHFCQALDNVRCQYVSISSHLMRRITFPCDTCRTAHTRPARKQPKNIRFLVDPKIRRADPKIPFAIGQIFPGVFRRISLHTLSVSADKSNHICILVVSYPNYVAESAPIELLPSEIRTKLFTQRGGVRAACI